MPIDDNEKAIFEERLAKEIEEAKYAKWKSEQLGHSITPKKGFSNAKMKVGAWVAFTGGMVLLAFTDTVFSTVTDVLGFLIVIIGLGVLFAGMKEDNDKRKNLGI